MLRIKIILVLGDSFRHRLFLEFLKRSHLCPQAVITVGSTSLLTRYRKAPASTLFSSIQSIVEVSRHPIVWFKLRKIYQNLLHIRVDDVNDNAVLNLINSLDSDLIFVYGSNLIKSQLLSVNTLWLNAHGGVLPGFRGLDSNLWAISEGRFDLVGYSVHRVLLRLDAGEVLVAKRVEVSSLIDLLLIRIEIALELSKDLVRILDNSIAFKGLDFQPNKIEDSVYRSSIVLLPLLKCLLRVVRKDS